MHKDLNFGTMFYSDYFESRCVVVHYKNDDNWYFVVENRPTKVLKAQVKLSEIKQNGHRIKTKLKE